MLLDRQLHGRDFIKRPTCPFCGLLIEPPKELRTCRPGEMPVGTCSCGAVYACDVTGRHSGEALIESLVFSCDMDWDLAWNLLPEEDYKYEIVDHYDLANHMIVPGGFFEGRRVSGVLFFVRLHKDVLEVSADGVRRKMEDAVPSFYERKMRRRPVKCRVSKTELEQLVRDFNADALIEFAREDPKIIRMVQRFLYSGDRLFRQRAAELLGRIAAVVGESEPKAVSNLLQNLFYAVSDTAASTWGAFEAIGEIIARKPDLFAGYMPQLYPFLTDATRRSQTVQALARIAASVPQLLRKITFHFIPLLKDPDPEVRGQTVRLLGYLQAGELKDDMTELLSDEHELVLYDSGRLEKTSVGAIAAEALQRL
ncbi:conserved hypothetical protein [uncultured Desulfatiglans sp.]|nr:conserved hypothetical protein [uncultured Desulfatiglans sp.]